MAATAAVAVGGTALLAPSAEAADFTVTTAADGTGPPPAGSLREAVEAANATTANDRILFDSTVTGTIALVEEIPVNVDPLVGGNLEIVGLAGREPTVSGGGASRIFNASGSGIFQVADLSLANGYVNAGSPDGYYGGAIRSEGELAINSVSFSGNYSEYAGGAVYSSGPLIVGSSDFIGNEAADGPGGAIVSYDEAIIGAANTFSGNSAYIGGAVAGMGGPMRIGSARFDGNYAYYGGALITSGAEVTISGAEFTGNEGVKYGGAIASAGSIIDFDDLTITGNTSALFGGGMALLAADGTINDSEISGNTIDSGGAFPIGIAGGVGVLGPSPAYAVEISNSSIDDNEVVGPAYGLGAGLVGAGRLTVNDSSISGNQATAGGIAGMSMKYGVTVNRSTIADNVASNAPFGAGGVLSKYGGTISRSTISGNTGAAGGIFASDGDSSSPQPADPDYALKLSNSTVSGNSAVGSDTTPGSRSGYGGGLYLQGQIGATIQNSTIAGNTAETGGGGIFSYAGDYGSYPAEDRSLSSTIVGDNRAAGSPNDLGSQTTTTPGVGFSAGFSLIENPGSADLESNPAGSNIIGQDPKLGALANNGGPTLTQLPGNGSPVIDKGTANGLTVDQRGEPRTVNTGASNAADGTDIGSVEIQDVTPPTTTITSGPAEGEIVIGDSVTFAFTANENGSTFECMLDSGAWESCTSPKTYNGLSSGDFHTFKVRATDGAGNTGPAVSRTFKTVGGFCNGTPATIVAKPGETTIGTEGPDVIVGTDEADEIRGLGGNDQICAAGGDDLVLGGEGDDEITGDQGADQIDGGTGADGLYGAGGADLLVGGTGDDFLYGANGDDRLRGKGGADQLDGAGGEDDIRGNAGADQVSAGPDDDVARGDGGDDVLRGNGGSDELRGAAGDDEIRGAGKPDALFGGKGDDFLNGGKGRNSCNGGPGKNTLQNCSDG